MSGQATIVILAGGQGARFWPISRSKKPKQFLALGRSSESLIQATARRVKVLCCKDGLWVVCGAQHAALVREHIPRARVIVEPQPRNTAASIGLAALYLERDDPKGVMVVLPADHSVEQETRLTEILNQAVELARTRDVLVTIGIPPVFPHTGYGYMRKGEELGKNSFKVTRFFEKPNLERARMYVESGGYFWNSGMFVWRADVILEALRQHMPELYKGLQTIRAALGGAQEKAVIEEVFNDLESVSIDFGVLELAKNCALVAGDGFGWSDVGSWDAWGELFEGDAHGNVTLGSTLLLDSTGCVVRSDHKLVALLGARDLVVIDSGDALLVCPRRRVQDVKLLVDELKKRGRNDLI